MAAGCSRWPGLVMAFAIAAAGAAPAGDREPPESLHDEVAALKEEIHSINLVDLLDLSAAQIDVILEQSRVARPWLALRRSELEAVYFTQLEVFREFKAEDEANRGLSEAVLMKAGRAEHLEREIDDRVFARLNVFSRKVSDALTNEQLRIVASYEPFLFPRERRDREMRRKSDSRYKIIRESLLAASGMSAARYRAERDDLVDRICSQMPRPQPVIRRKPQPRPESEKKDRGKAVRNKSAGSPAPPDGEAAVKDRIGRVLDEVRTMSAEEAEKSVDAIMENDLFSGKAERLLREMRAIARSRHASLNTVARYLLNPDVVPYLEKIRPRAGKGVTTGVR